MEIGVVRGYKRWRGGKKGACERAWKWRVDLAVRGVWRSGNTKRRSRKKREDEEDDRSDGFSCSRLNDIQRIYAYLFKIDQFTQLFFCHFSPWISHTTRSLSKTTIMLTGYGRRRYERHDHDMETIPRSGNFDGIVLNLEC